MVYSLKRLKRQLKNKDPDNVTSFSTLSLKQMSQNSVIRVIWFYFLKHVE